MLVKPVSNQGHPQVWLDDTEGWHDILYPSEARELAAQLIAAADEVDPPTSGVVAKCNGTAVESTKRGTRLAEDWVPSTPVRKDLASQYPNLLLGDILTEFRDYWCAIPGQRGTKLSWDRTFRNRVREVAHLPRYQRRRGLSTVDQKIADLQATKEPE